MATWVDPYPEAPLSKIYERRSMVIGQGTGQEIVFGPCTFDHLMEQYELAAVEVINGVAFADALNQSREFNAPMRVPADGQVIEETPKRHAERLRYHSRRGFKPSLKKAPPKPAPAPMTAEERQKKLEDLKRRVDKATETAKKMMEDAARGETPVEDWAEGWHISVGVSKTAIVNRRVVNELVIEEKEDGWNIGRAWEEEGWIVSFGTEGMKVTASKRMGREEKITADEH